MKHPGHVELDRPDGTNLKMTMRFAAIADVHGNHLALEAVVADIRAQGIDELRSRCDGGLGAPQRAARTRVRADDGLDQIAIQASSFIGLTAFCFN